MRSFLRILKFSLQDISRNVWLSIVTVTILILALLSINLLVTVKIISENAVAAVKEKVDISLYLREDASEDKIMELKDKVTALEGVKSVSYTSKEDALAFFREKNKNNPQIMEALRELGNNPLQPSLVIVPSAVESTEKLIQNLQVIESDIIDSRDFSDNRSILQKINNITNRVSEAGLVLILIFIFTSLLVVYNAIRVAIYTHRKEIAIMRLVGASNYFIYLPFIFSSLIYALVSVIVIILVFFPFLGLLQPYMEVFFNGYNADIMSYFVDNSFRIFGGQFLIVAAINVAASALAVKRYTRV
jgi:cell division transport system permease protein